MATLSCALMEFPARAQDTNTPSLARAHQHVQPVPNTDRLGLNPNHPNYEF